MSELKLLEELKRALVEELWAVTFYSDSMRRVSDKKAKVLFAKMAEASAVHSLILLKETNALLLKSSLPAEKGKDATLLSEKGFLEELAMEDIYKSIIPMTKDPNLKKTLSRLVAEEKDHEKQIKQLMQSELKSKRLKFKA